MLKEPAALLPQILKAAESRPDKSTDTDLIYCRLGHSLPDRAEAAWEDLAALINERSANDIIGDKCLYAIFKDRRHGCKSSTFQRFWLKIADSLRVQHTNDSCTPQLLFRLCNLYCITKSPTSNRNHRCIKFETLFREMILLDVCHGLSGWLPSVIASYAEFLISCSDTNIITLPRYFVERIEQMSDQFRTSHVVRIAISLDIRQRNADRWVRLKFGLWPVAFASN